jgi:hypothetical protein
MRLVDQFLPLVSDSLASPKFNMELESIVYAMAMFTLGQNPDTGHPK